MITKINSVSNPAFNILGKNNKTVLNNKKILNSNENITSPNSDIKGVPIGYISFREKEKTETIKFNADAAELYKSALNIAAAKGHKQLTAYHIIDAVIQETEKNLLELDETLLATGVFENVSTLNKLADFYAKTNMIQKASDRVYFLEAMNQLKEENDKYLEQLPVSEEALTENDVTFANDLGKNLLELKTEINSYMLLGTAFNTLTTQGIEHPNDFLKSFISFSLYTPNEEIVSNYMKQFDKRAIEVWNRLALGSNLVVTSNDDKEVARMISSIVNTIDETKHGGFNSKNTLTYAIAEGVEPATLLQEISEVAESLPDKKLVFMIDMGDLLAKSVSTNDKQQVEISPEFLALGSIEHPNVKLIMFNKDDSFYQLMQDPTIRKSFGKFLTYDIPPILTYEAQSIIASDKTLMKDIKTKFSKEARDKAVLFADKMEGVFPDKAIDLMQRISNYYDGEKKTISVKDVDEFAYIAHDLFDNEKSNAKIIYDTGKTLANYYGKDTTKKDIEAIIRQIKTGRIGTRGMVIYSKDEEAGSGRKYTAQVIAGEAKVPFMEISSSDFAIAGEDEETKVKIAPAIAMEKAFVDLKNAAKQNENKTAIMYINNFEEFAFSGPYLAGYKQAMSQLVREMAKAEAEDVNILVIGSTDEYYVDAIPTVVRGFSQTIAVDSPAFNKQARKDILANRIAEKNIALDARTKADKEVLINKLVKLTEYLSFVQIKSLIDKAEQIMSERNKSKVGIGEFIEAYLQLETGRTSKPEMPMYNKEATTSHECGHATNLEVMSNLYKEKGKPWHQAREVNFITLDPRGNFLGAVFEGRAENTDYPFEAMFADLVCSYGGHSCEKMFFNMDGSSGISQDLAQAAAAAKRGIEYFGFGFNTGKVSNAVGIKSGVYNENVFKDMDVMLTNAQIVSDLITENYKKFNEWFTQKYSRLIGTDDCMVDGDDFRKLLANWKKAQSPDVKAELEIMEDMILDIIKATKNGKKYGKISRAI